MSRFMLDTNTVSYIVTERVRDPVRARNIPLAELCISSITEGELLFGLARRPDAHKLARLTHQFLESIDSIPFDSVAAGQFADLRTKMERSGKSLTQLDMLIAAHALAVDAVLVTSDKAFLHVPDLKIENWA